MSSKYLFTVIAFITITAQSLIPPALGSTLDHGAVILQYHHIHSATPPSTSTSPERFLEHVNLIEQEGFQVKPLPWLIQRIQNKQTIPDKTVVITFDDGYLSIYENAFPVLKDKGWPFTIFISPQAIDEKWGESLTWRHLSEMQAAKGTIANHSFSHRHLLERVKIDTGATESKQQWLDRIRLDIEQTEERIKEELGVSHKLLAYPYGEYNQDLQALVRELGYVALGQQSGPVGVYSDLTALPRFPAAGIYANPITLKTKLYTLPFTVLNAANPTELMTQEAPKLIFSVKAGNFRRKHIQCFYQGAAIPTSLRQTQDTIIVHTQAESLSKGRRHRYNCTAPSQNGKRYYWFSHPWLRS